MNLKKPDQKIIAGCALKIRRYIERLEAHIEQQSENSTNSEMSERIAELEAENKVSTEHIEQMHHRCDSLIKQVRDLQCDNTERQEPTKLDQFAMTALHGLVSHTHLPGIEAAAAAYNYAEAMQAESRKRQGGAV